VSDTLVLQSPPFSPFSGLRPDPAVTRQQIATLIAEAEREEDAEDDIHRQIEDLEEEAGHHGVRAVACRVQAESLANPEPTFDLPLPIVVVFTDRDRKVEGVECSVCGSVCEFGPESGRITRQGVIQNAAKRHAEVEHDGLVVAEGWAR
jgi:hypothetical protein